MKILVLGKFNLDSFGSHIADTLTIMGHQSFKCEVGVRYRHNKHYVLNQFEKLRMNFYDIFQNTTRGQNIELRNIYKKSDEKIDLIISTYDFFYPEQVNNLKKHFNCPIVLWYPDSIQNLRKSLFANADYNYIFFKDLYIVNKLREDYGFNNVYYLPQCFNPLKHNIFETTNLEIEYYSSDLTTAGNLHVYRIKLFEHLINYDIKIWGNPAPIWLNTSSIKQFVQNKYVTNREKSIVFHNSKIVINNQHPSEIFGVNIRTFEIAGAGGFQITNKKSGLNQLFKVGKEIITYENINDLKEKVDYYLLNEEERKIIAEASYKRAHKEHTYKNRLTILLDTVFGKSTGFKIPFISCKDEYDES